MIRSGGSYGFTETERNPSSLTMRGVHKLVRRAANGNAGRAGSQPAGSPREADDKEKGRPAAACSLLPVNTRPAAKWLCS
jgi:hypothetical protein